jgi:hypothetical protein
MVTDVFGTYREGERMQLDAVLLQDIRVEIDDSIIEGKRGDLVTVNPVAGYVVIDGHCIEVQPFEYSSFN